MAIALYEGFAQPHGLMFHHFHDDGKFYRGQGSINQHQFAAILDGYGSRLTSATEWHRRAKAGLLVDEVCLTFDDTLLCQFELALPVLEARELDAYWFICSEVLAGVPLTVELHRFFRTTYFDTVDDFYTSFDRAAEAAAHLDVKAARREFRGSKYLSQWSFYTDEDRWFRFLRTELLGHERYTTIIDDMILASALDRDHVLQRLMMQNRHVEALAASGHVVGMHSHSHPLQMSTLPPEGQEQEYKLCSESLTELTGQTPDAMSHPVNSYSSHTLKVLEDLGVLVGFCSRMTPWGPNLLELPRIDHTFAQKALQL